MAEVGSDAATLRDYLRVARRRKWVILQALVLVPAAGVAFSLKQEPIYEASADALLIRGNLAASLTGTRDPDAGQPADRLAQTQASLARVPLVARRVLRATGLRDRSPQALLRASSVSTTANTDLLEFKVTDPNPTIASRLATEYARQFTLYRRELGTAGLVHARKEVEGQLASLEAQGDRTSALYASLVDKEQQLRTMEALQTSSAVLVAAGGAAQVQPKPVRDGALGIVLGLVLGVGLAFLWEALDTRVRSEEDIREALDLPLLARVPAPPRKLRNQNRLTMLADAGSGHAEAYRVLRTNFEFVNVDRGAQMIMITSAVEGEGKSTTAANLAIAFARAGRRVLLVDLDLRRPFLDRFFGLEEEPGLTAATLGHVELQQAVFRVALGAAGKSGLLTADGNGTGSIEGTLEVVPSGPVPPDPGEFIASRALAVQLDSLRERAELVLIDSPPLLHVGDALALSALVDALVVVTRLDVVRAPILVELRRALDSTRADKLGFVLTGADLEAGYADGHEYVRGHAYAREAAGGVGP